MNNEKLIKVDNTLTEARYALSKTQLDIFFLVISKIKQSDVSDTYYKIGAKEFEEYTGKEFNYKHLRVATKGLLTKAIEFHDKYGNFIQTAFIASTQYIENKGYLEIEIADKLRPYLIELKEQYTTFQLRSSLALSSKFAKRIYMFCSQWKTVGKTRKYSIEELKFMLDLKGDNEKNSFERWSAFKTKVLDVSVKQINTYTDLRINYRLEKDGRRIAYIIFDVEKTDAAQSIINFDVIETDERKAMRERLIGEFKLRKDQADKILLKFDMKEINRMLFDIKLKKINNEIKSLGAYSSKVFDV
jgi:plasmid replication initiation protein